MLRKKTMNQEEALAWGVVHYLGRHPELVGASQADSAGLEG